MATIRILLGIICLTIFGGFIKPSGHFLRVLKDKEEKPRLSTFAFPLSTYNLPLLTFNFPLSTFNFPLLTFNLPLSTFNLPLLTFNLPLLTFNFQFSTPQSKHQTQIIRIACSQLHIREATGQNDGEAVETYLQYTQNKKGEPWCASFVSWIFGQAGFNLPRTAWSPALFPLAKRTKQPAPASVFGIYFLHLKRIGHCGLVESVQGNWINTIEGNTNAINSRDGDGVYRKLRHKRTIAVYADWLN